MNRYVIEYNHGGSSEYLLFACWADTVEEACEQLTESDNLARNFTVFAPVVYP